VAAENGKAASHHKGEDTELINLLLDYGGEINTQTNTVNTLTFVSLIDVSTEK